MLRPELMTALEAKENVRSLVLRQATAEEWAEKTREALTTCEKEVLDAA